MILEYYVSYSFIMNPKFLFINLFLYFIILFDENNQNYTYLYYIFYILKKIDIYKIRKI